MTTQTRPEETIPSFPLLDEYVGRRLDVDLSLLPPGRSAVVESARRLRREESYGFIHALWWVWLVDGRSAVSIPPGARPAVARVVVGVHAPGQLFEPALAGALRAAVDPVLLGHNLAPSDRARCNLCYACSASRLRRHEHGDLRRLVDASLRVAEGIWFPDHCLPHGIVYGVVADGMVVSVANAHRTGLMEDRVADLGVVTSPAYRRRGYAQAAVSAVAAEITARGGEALYDPSPDNLASIATAESVGFTLYGHALVIAAPAS